MKKKTTLYIVQAAVIAALYAVLTILQNTLLSGTASMAVQFQSIRNYDNIRSVYACRNSGTDSWVHTGKHQFFVNAGTV